MTIDTAADTPMHRPSAAWGESARDSVVDSSRRARGPASRPRASIYAALDPGAREPTMNAVLAQMIRRSGAPDPRRGTLERRERAMAALAQDAVVWRGPLPVSPAEVRQHMTRAPIGPLSARTLWALTVAKLSEAAAYGVGLERKSWSKRAPNVDDWSVYVNLEEGYHTRLFHVVLGALGVDMRRTPPAWIARVAIRLVLASPGWLRRALLFTAEALACVVVAHLLRLVRPLFGDQPIVCDRIERALGEVLADDVAHVRLLRGSMSSGAMRVASALRTWVIGVFAGIAPEVDALIGRERLHYACDSLDLDALAAIAERARGAAPLS